MVAGFKRKMGSFTTTSGPAAVTLALGFVPDYFKMVADQATAGTIEKVEWWSAMGNAKALVNYCIADSGTTGDKSTSMVDSGGISTYTASGIALERWNSLTGGSATAVAVGQVVTPSKLPSGFTSMPVFQCTTAGNTGTTEPTWNTTIGATTTDSGVTWTMIDSGTEPSKQAILGYSYPPLLGSTGAAEEENAGMGVSIPAALLIASTTYFYLAEAGTT